jgi:hypothetical protein
MKSGALRSILALIVALVIAGPAFGVEEVYYARCNLRVVKGVYISWENWQSTPMFIPVNTKLRATWRGSKATLVRADNGSRYELEAGAAGDQYMEKFVSRHPVSLSHYPKDIRSNIQDAVARVGMTKEQVFIAMGPPTVAGAEKTRSMTYDQIMSSDLWVYARRRFSKNIGVAFDPATGKVSRTEAMLR